MGIIDERTFTLTCDACKVEEVRKAVQKGSAYNLGNWRDFDPFTLFIDVQTKRDDGPWVTAATCKTCKGPARIAPSPD